MHDDAGRRLLHLAEPRAELGGDPALAELSLDLLGELLVLERQQVGERLDDRDVGAERPPDARELDADDAATEHDDRTRHVVEGEGVVAGDDAGAVDLKTWQRLGHRSGGQDDVASGVGGVADGDGVGANETARALDEGDAAALHQPGQPLVEAGDDAVLVGVDRCHVDAVERRLDAELLTFAGGVSDLGRVQQRLGGDAALVQAGATELALLDQHDVEAELGGAQGAGIATAATAEDHDVVNGAPGVLGHGRLLCGK